MKTLKKGSVLLVALLLIMSFAYAQSEQPSMFVVHTDNVKFDKMAKYEELSKQLKDACEKHNVEGTNWTAITVEDGRYVYVSPITSMADLDNSPLGNLGKKMGNDNLSNMLAEMDQCYDSHYDYVIHHSADLSYLPKGYSTEGKSTREYHFLYYSPKNAAAMKEAMAGIKNVYKTKGIKNGYNVYHSGFGSEEAYYMVEVAGEDTTSIAMGGKANSEILGDEGKAALFGIIQLASRYDQVNGEFREDLSYYPSND
ncbi:MAG: hypothetical protein HKN40_01355 [Winogradskyella sp.]|uniref:hypothetical protein n=1 Tax=Winogradskyella sp. TaxID=1883156 RepID=UPI00179CD881|nr:hypothetical protein [Winogradskyella sp.]